MPSPRPARRQLAAVTLACLLVLAGCAGAFGPVIRQMPDRPQQLTADSALEYAKTYERRYVRNQVITSRSNVNAVEVTYRTAEVTNETAEGYLVHLRYTLRVDQGGDVTTENYTANYLVTDSVTRRAVAEGFQDPGPPARNGTVMERE